MDTMATGFRIMIGAAGPAELGALQSQVAAAFEEKAKFEADVALVTWDMHQRLTELGDRGVGPGQLREAYDRVYKRIAPVDGGSEV
jgi:hypothetical protein